MSSLLENVRQFFHDLYMSVREGRTSYHDALRQVPLPIFYLTAGTPGRIGAAIEQHAIIASHDALVPVREARSLTWSVLSLVQHFRTSETYNTSDTREAIEFQWTMLRGFIYNAVAPGRVQYWMTGLVQQPGLEEAVIQALTDGAFVYNSHHDQAAWRHDPWESSVSTDQIIEWFRTACEEARQQNDIDRL